MKQVQPTLGPLLKEFTSAAREDKLEEYYEDHVKRIREIVPADKLLEFNAKQGWEPLCEFLDRPMPSQGTPFPHVNERYLLQLENTILWGITWIWPLIPLLLMYAILIVTRNMQAQVQSKKQL